MLLWPDINNLIDCRNEYIIDIVDLDSECRQVFPVAGRRGTDFINFFKG